MWPDLFPLVPGWQDFAVGISRGALLHHEVGLAHTAVTWGCWTGHQDTAELGLGLYRLEAGESAWGHCTAVLLTG